MFGLLTVQTMSDMSTSIDALLETFTGFFTAAWNMTSGNWFLLACVGLPLISGVLFSVINFFRNR